MGTCRAAAAADRGTGEKAAGDRLPFGRRMLPLHVEAGVMMNANEKVAVLRYWLVLML